MVSFSHPKNENKNQTIELEVLSAENLRGHIENEMADGALDFRRRDLVETLWDVGDHVRNVNIHHLSDSRLPEAKDEFNRVALWRIGRIEEYFVAALLRKVLDLILWIGALSIMKRTFVLPMEQNSKSSLM